MPPSAIFGVGLFCGIQLVRDKKSRALWDSPLKVGALVQDLAHEGGLYLRSIAPDRISFMPPLNINEDEISEGLTILKHALDKAWSRVMSVGP